MSSEGWISLYRKFLDWEWYDDANTMRLFIHLLLSANHKDNKWRGKLIRRGELITSQPKLANSLKLSIMQIRNSLNKLKRTGEITVKPTSEYSIISIKKYNSFQDDNSQNNERKTQHKQTGNRRTTTNNNDNKRDINKLISLSIEEREILKKYLLETSKKKIDDIDAYIRKLVDNGDCQVKLEKAKQRLKKQKQGEVVPPPEEPEDPQKTEKARVKAQATVNALKRLTINKKETENDKNSTEAT